MDKISLPLIGAVCFLNLTWCINSFSQWTFCGGVPLTGQISISVADPNTVVVFTLWRLVNISNQRKWF